MVIVICLLIIAGIFFGDLWIKNHIEKTMVDGITQRKLGGKLLIRKHHNKGAVLNIGEKKRPVIVVISVLMSLVISVLFFLSLGQRGNNLLRIGFSLMLGGAFSNTYDRLKRKYVVDYVSFGVRWDKLRRIVFNISDFCIIIGALLVALGAGR